MYNEYMAFKPMTVANAPTTPDIEGPFYKDGAPFRQSLCDRPTLMLSGVVTDTSGQPIPSAVLDFWQADEKGEYDNEGYNFRGKVVADKSGRTSASGNRYDLWTVRPGDYKISDTEFRCAHIHVKITAEGFKPLTTQLYFPGDAHNDTDHWFDPSRVIVMTKAGGRFNFILEKAG